MSYLPTGTVYGTLLNFKDEVAALAPKMNEAPYKAPPKAPVLYVKTANTCSASGSSVPVPAHVPQVEIGATVGMVIGKDSRVAGYVLMNDFSVPHASFFRPPVRFKCLDGFLGVGEVVAPASAGASSSFKLEVRVDGELKQTVDFAGVVRNEAQLLADVGAFMTLREGDVLLLGVGVNADGKRPQAAPGSRVEISAAGFPTLVNTLVKEAA